MTSGNRFNCFDCDYDMCIDCVKRDIGNPEFTKMLSDSSSNHQEGWYQKQNNQYWDVNRTQNTGSNMAYGINPTGGFGYPDNNINSSNNLPYGAGIVPPEGQEDNRYPDNNMPLYGHGYPDNDINSGNNLPYDTGNVPPGGQENNRYPSNNMPQYGITPDQHAGPTGGWNV